MAAQVDISKLLTDERIKAIFHTFDVDNCGRISKSDLKEALSKLGKDVSDEEVESIMKKHDLTGSDNLDINEFR